MAALSLEESSDDSDDEAIEAMNSSAA